MARRKAAIHPLPDWFDLRAYNVLLTLTNEQLFEELTFRLFGIIQSKNTDEWLPAISSKNVLIASTSKSTLGLCPNPHIEKLVLYDGPQYNHWTLIESNRFIILLNLVHGSSRVTLMMRPALWLFFLLLPCRLVAGE